LDLEEAELRSSIVFLDQAEKIVRIEPHCNAASESLTLPVLLRVGRRLNKHDVSLALVKLFENSLQILCHYRSKLSRESDIKGFPKQNNVSENRPSTQNLYFREIFFCFGKSRFTEVTECVRGIGRAMIRSRFKAEAHSRSIVDPGNDPATVMETM
jgi:hypothetical protein